ncbi:MAG: N-formylglutamate amidohydrolase [Nanoarchaeota archaeon]|nr:N-formylglutamate amidohydrolase [Nanoarchaeota archaeon]
MEQEMVPEKKSTRQKISEAIKKYTYIKILKTLKRVNENIENKHHKNFIALLDTHEMVIDVLDGTIRYFYNNRNSIWFRMFFYDNKVYQLVKEDIERYNKEYPRIKLTITKKGTMIFDNYRKNSFNTLLLTIHSGTWAPKEIKKKMAVEKKVRMREEDRGSDLIYSDIMLKNSGIWIKTMQSRFVCDFNRARKDAVYRNGSEPRVKNIWKEEFSEKDKKKLLREYDRFYHILDKLIDTHRFNIIFDGHSMVDEPDRPSVSFGTKYIPKFYMPIVDRMRSKLSRDLKEEVAVNKPFEGGYILKYLSKRFPDVFIFSVEVNKRLYMDKKHSKVSEKKLKEISSKLESIFDFEI